MADDVDAELAEFEDKAPLAEEAVSDPASQEADPAKEGADAAEEWKPPSKDHWDNIQKALRTERDARRREAQSARAYEQNIAQIEQRVQSWQQQMLAQQLQQPPPDAFESPEAAQQRLHAQQALLQHLHQAEQQRQAQIAQSQRQEREIEYVSKTVDDYEAEFVAQSPDYHDATDYMLKLQQDLLEGAGYPPDVAAQQIAIWSVNVAKQALQAGRDPAEWAYEHARRMGYRPKGSSAEAAAEKLAAMRAGQASAKTLSGGGAGAKGGGTSLKQIAGLEGAAFDSAMEKYLNDSIRGR